MFTLDVKQHDPHPDKDLPNDSQTNIHSNNVYRHDSSHNNKHPQSVGHPKPGPTQDPLFFTIFTSQNKVFTQTGNGGRSSFKECSKGMGWGERERFRWYSDGGMFVEMDRGGVLTYGKRRSMCILSILKFACAFEQANQSLLFTFWYPVKSRL